MSPEIWRLLVAASPIVVVLVLLALRVRSVLAGCIGLAVALAGAFLSFRITIPQAQEVLVGLGPLVIEVAVILLGGIGLAHSLDRSGAQDRIAGWLDDAERGTERVISLVLLTFGLTPFMESVTGFGLGVVITAPLLIRLGLTPVRAVITGLLGLVLVPWGSLGPGTLVAAQLGGADLTDLGYWSALLTLPVLIIAMAAALGLNLGRAAWAPRTLGLAVGVIALQWVVLVATNWALGVPLAGIFSSAVVTASLLALTRWRQGRLPAVGPELRRDLIPYVVLVAGILAVTGLVALTGADHLEWLASPALWLVIGAAVALRGAAQSAADRWALLAQTLRRWWPVASTALVFMILGIVMAGTGMAEHLARSASAAGPLFTAAIPAIGALGGYLTGSNTGAAAMFSTATTAAAESLSIDPLVALAGQNVAGSYAIIASPPRVALAVGVALPAGERLPPKAIRILLGVLAGVVVALGVLVSLIA